MPDDFYTGRHEAMLQAADERMNRIEDKVNMIDKKLDTVVIALAEYRGLWKFVTAFATVAGAVASLLVNWFVGRQHT